jgi:hypothetical protein
MWLAAGTHLWRLSLEVIEKIISKIKMIVLTCCL